MKTPALVCAKKEPTDTLWKPLPIVLLGVATSGGVRANAHVTSSMRRHRNPPEIRLSWQINVLRKNHLFNLIGPMPCMWPTCSILVRHWHSHAYWSFVTYQFA